MGGPAPVAQAVVVVADRRRHHVEIGSGTAAADGCRSRRAGPVDERSQRSAGKALIRRIGVVVAILALVAGCSAKEGSEETTTSPAPPPTAAAVTPDQARAIAKEAYIYGFPIVDNYRVMYSYFVN